MVAVGGASRPGRLTPREGAPDVHRRGGCVGLSRRSGPCEAEEMNDWPARPLRMDSQTCNPQRTDRTDWDIQSASNSFHFMISQYEIFYIRRAQFPVARSLWWLNFVQWRLTFVGLLHVTFLAHRILRWRLDCWKIWPPWSIFVYLAPEFSENILWSLVPASSMDVTDEVTHMWKSLETPGL